ncbi:MAG: fructosamine kinase family protein [Anaerolineae bacterium]|nr:fructosamine kinase family protein [Anaerolineae bacterium]
MLAQQLKYHLGAGVRHLDSLHGGCIGQVYLAYLDDDRRVVVKAADEESARLDLEAYMLRYLAAHSQLPVPAVLHDQPHLLILSHLPGDSRFGVSAQEHAAELLAALHAVTAPQFGLERDTLIGGLHQPNPWTDSWLDFFAEHRLRYMAHEAERAGRLPAGLRHRVESLASHLHRWLHEPEQPSLIHGDVWTTNVLAQGGRITGFLDPAIYYADPEIELAFTTLFGTFAKPFFRRYQEIRPLPPGFFEERRDLYNLYPLLVHVRLFGGTYVDSVERTLARFGF